MQTHTIHSIIQVNRNLLHSLETVQKLKPILSLYVSTYIHARMYVRIYCTDTCTYVCTYVWTVVMYMQMSAHIRRSLLPVHSELKHSWRTCTVCYAHTHIHTYVWGLAQCYTLTGLHMLNQKEHWRSRNWHQQMWYCDVRVYVYRSLVKTPTVRMHLHPARALLLASNDSCPFSRGLYVHSATKTRWAVHCV